MKTYRKIAKEIVGMPEITARPLLASYGFTYLEQNTILELAGIPT